MEKKLIIIAVVVCVMAVANIAIAVPVVPGYTVQTYAEVDLPMRMAFDSEEILYVGHYDASYTQSYYIRRIGLNGTSVSNYGNSAFVDADAVAVDADGQISGTPGTLLVGCGYPGRIYGIKPDESVLSLFTTNTAFYNPTQMIFDSTGRLLILDPTYSAVYQTSGNNPTILFSTPTASYSIAVGANDEIFISDNLGVIRIYENDVLSEFATLPYSGEPYNLMMAFTEGNEHWEAGLYVVSDDTGELYRFDSQGQPTSIGTGFNPPPHAIDLVFGPDGALYVSTSTGNEILRIVPEPPCTVSEDFELDPGWVSTEPSNIKWDPAGFYRARVTDNPSDFVQWGYSPLFQEVSDASFSFEFDVNPVAPSYGTYPGLHLIGEGVTDPFVGSSLGIWVANADEFPNNFVIQGIAYGSSSPIYFSSPEFTVGEWYHQRVDYDAESKTLSWKISLVGMPDGSFYNNTYTNISVAPFKQVIVGYQSGGPIYGSWAEAYVDNIVVCVAEAAVEMEWVTIGNAGNPGDTRTGIDPYSPYGDPFANPYGCGAVGYEYQIGKYEVTNAQWNAFTSAAGAPTGNPSNAYDQTSTYPGAQQPTNEVSWYEAAQFCNYLTSGDKSLGVYLFSGDNNDPCDFLGIDRTAAQVTYGTIYFLPTEDEWYKAAYYKPDGSGYSTFANGLDTMPVVGGGWNYYDSTPWNVGTGTEEQNGTFDMMGNVWEWNETLMHGSYRSARSGSFYVGHLDGFTLSSSHRHYMSPDDDWWTVGFRVARIAEPEPVEMEWVTVGDAGNAADDTGYGAVDYEYRIGKYEVTNAQYCAFLNAVAGVSDTYNVYDPRMNDNTSYGGIQQIGSPGIYTYLTKGGRENWPIVYISFYDTLRFANWMHNGKPTGVQDSSTTEDGAYMLTGQNSVAVRDHPIHGANGRNSRAEVWLPSEDEWYKAAYYKGGGTNAGYWDYPTQSDSVPNNNWPAGDSGNSANWNHWYQFPYLTNVGAYTLSGGAYGTFDQTGNVWEWNEAIIGSWRGLRGGSCGVGAAYWLPASNRVSHTPVDPADELDYGFRVVRAVEPACVASEYEFLTEWGSYGTGDGQFRYPQCLATDSSGNVYVTDYWNHRVQKFDSNGNFITKWGSSGSGDGQFNDPVGIAIDSSDYVYVADSWNDRVQKFDSDGNFVTKWGSSGSGDGQFNTSFGIAVDSAGYIYVTDRENDRIQKFTSDGTFVTKWGSQGSGNGQFDGSVNIATDSAGDVYIVEIGSDRVQKFTSNGIYITQWGSLGTGDGQFDNPSGIAIDSSGYVYVTDGKNDRVQKFTSDGTFVTKWGSLGTGDGLFDKPFGITIGSSGSVYVVDHINHRVQKFEPICEPANTAPDANAGEDQTCDTGPGGTGEAVLDCSGSDDPDGDELTYTWYLDGEEIATGCNPTIELPCGTYTLELIVNDGTVDSEPDYVEITVLDGTPPEISCPNNVTLECPADTSPAATGEATATDECDDAPVITYSDLTSGTCPKVIERTWTATDAAGNEGSCVQVITVEDTTPPVITCPADVTLECPADTSPAATGEATGSDACGSVIITHSDVSVPGCGNTEVISRTWTATDDCGNSTSCVQTITVVDTTAPLISNVDADWLLAAVGQTVTFSADVNDDCDGDVNVVWDFGDGTAPSPIPSHGYGEPNIYNVTVTATDDCGNGSTDSIIIVVYDPSAGFTTGGGWFVPDSNSFIDGNDVTDTVSKANFGFIVKYKKGADNPDGNLEFQYKAGDINLRSSDMEWLVVQSATKVRFKGKATINGEGLYTFKVTAEDNGEPGTGDWFKIEIWMGPDVDTENGPPVPKHKAQGYLGGGNVQIHQK